MKHIIIFIFIVLKANLLLAQTIDNTKVVENIIEEIAISGEDEIDYISLFDDLMFFIENPLNLNTATRSDLEKIQFLNDFQTEGILDYLRFSGKMQTIYELQLIDGFSIENIQKLLPFVKVEKAEKNPIPNFRKALKFGNHTVFMRTRFLVQEQKGFSEIAPEDLEENPNKRYLGNKFQYYTRYKFDYKRKLQFGFVAEKDAGEEFFKGTQKSGFDYYSGHLTIKNIWKFKTISIGDYQVKFGQGLIAWTGFSSGKSSYVLNIRKKYSGIRKYSSSDENRFMRGTAGTLNLGNFDITGFISYKNIDGNIANYDTISDEAEIITSFQKTGLHRTESEFTDRKVVSEFIYGGNLQWNKNNFKIGTSYIQYIFGKELNKNLQAYQQFDFQGSKNTNVSIDYQANYHNFYFFGEFAKSLNGGYAALNGALIKLAPQISLAALHRHYTRNYQAYYSAGFSEKTGTANEKGLYLGTEIYPFRKFTLSVYYDIYKFPWLRFNADAPSNGFDFLVLTEYNLNRNVQMYLRYKQENKLVNSTDDYTGILPLTLSLHKDFRFHISYKISKNLILKNRIGISEYKNENQKTETGFLLYQDINYKMQNFPLAFNFRFGLFDADYNARIYAYENDILYGYSIPSHSGKGFRTYFNIKYTIIKDFIDIWLRYANFGYVEKKSIGTSLSEISGNNKSEIKFQIRIKLKRKPQYKKRN